MKKMGGNICHTKSLADKSIAVSCARLAKDAGTVPGGKLIKGITKKQRTGIKWREE